MTTDSDTLPTATRVADPGIRALYRQENRWRAWLDVEAALARAQAELGIIPAAAAEAIAAKARLELMDRARITEGFARTGHTLVPLVWELGRIVGEPHGGWVHWGATTQNITQTGDLLVLRQAHAIFLRPAWPAPTEEGRPTADDRTHPAGFWTLTIAFAAMSICATLPLPARSSACAAAAPMAMQGPITRTLESAALSPSMQRPAATMLSASAGTRLPNGT